MLAVNTLSFWIFTIVFLLISLIFSEDKKRDEPSGIGTFCIVLIYFAVFYFAGGKKTIKEFFHSFDFISYALYFFFYLVIGVVWSLFKWFKKVKTSAMCNIKLRVKDHMHDIGGWIIIWPFSVIRFITFFLVGDLVSFISKKMSWAYEKIANDVFEKYNK